jgi:putative acetyltransferase
MLIIREATLQDVNEIAILFHNTIRRINVHDYSPAQIERWAGTAPEPEKWKARLETHQTFVACLGGEIAGFAEFETDGHIDALYVHHDHQNEGIASLLLERIEQEAKRLEIVRLYTEASRTACLFFERKGFVVIQSQDVEYRGVRFRNYKMEKYRTA